jgi:hypothetical protein
MTKRPADTPENPERRVVRRRTRSPRLLKNSSRQKKGQDQDPRQQLQPAEIEARIRAAEEKVAEANARAEEAEKRIAEERAQRERAEKQTVKERALREEERAQRERAEKRIEAAEKQIAEEKEKLLAQSLSFFPSIENLTFTPFLSSSKPSIPDYGKEVTCCVQDFRFRKDIDSTKGPSNKDIFGSALSGPLDEDTSEVRIESEAKLASLVIAYLSHLLYATGLMKKFMITQESGKMGLRPDMYVLSTKEGNPVGVVEVKKPNMSSSGEEPPKGTPISEMGVLVQMNDYLMLLKTMHGVDHPIGILTTLAESRVCWLGSLPDIAAVWKGEGEYGIVKKSLSNVPRNNKSDCTNVMNISSVVSIKEHANILNQVVASALFAMSLCTTSPSRNPFELSGQVFVKITPKSRSLMWSPNRVFKKPKGLVLPKRPKANCDNLVLLKSLGVGAHGYTWLAASDSGALCVLKFQHPKPGEDDEEGEDIRKELAVWRKVHPNLKVKVQTWRKQFALIMPYLAQATKVDSASIRDGVDAKEKETLEAVEVELNNFASNNIEHLDVKWANIGFYRTKKGELKAVLIDHAAVKDWGKATWNREVWVKKCMEMLKGNNS